MHDKCWHIYKFLSARALGKLVLPAGWASFGAALSIVLCDSASA